MPAEEPINPKYHPLTDAEFKKMNHEYEVERREMLVEEMKSQLRISEVNKLTQNIPKSPNKIDE